MTKGVIWRILFYILFKMGKPIKFQRKQLKFTKFEVEACIARETSFEESFLLFFYVKKFNKVKNNKVLIYFKKKLCYNFFLQKIKFYLKREVRSLNKKIFSNTIFA